VLRRKRQENAAMGHGPEQHLEHAEHAAHAAHDEFNKRVTMSIAIVAAILAGITMLGHKAHNETLISQGHALSLQTKASIKSTDAANKWAYYQSKNMFNLESEITLDLLSVLATREDRSNEFAAIQKKHEANVKKYQGDVISESGGDPKKVQGKLAKEKEKAEALQKEADDLLKQAEEKLKESHTLHRKADRFDLGELGLQLGVVLCSLAILTKGRGFWFAGLLGAAIGLAIALSAQLGHFLEHH
jgi:hypothetical protein